MNMNTPSTLHLLRRLFIHACGSIAAGLLLVACGGGGSIQDPDPLVEDYGIAYVKRPLEFDMANNVIQPDIREIEGYTPGGDLYYRDLASPSAQTRNITGALTGGMGDVKDVEVSYDGTKLLFSLRLDDIPNVMRDQQNKWDLYEYDIPTDTLKRLTTANTSLLGDDVAPHYLPDGRIIFSSNRQRQFRATLTDESKGTGPFYALDENRNEHAMMLHIMNGDGSNIRQISSNPSHDLDAIVLESQNNPLESGKVVFSRWDNMGGREQISLYKMNPDGTGLQLLYGAHSHATGTNGATVQFSQPREMPDGRLMTVMLPFANSNRGGDLVLVDTQNYIDNTFPTAVNAGVLFGPAQTPATTNVIHTDNTISPGGRFMSAWPLLDGTNRALVGWSACRLVENTQIVPCTPARLANPAAVEADPIYGIYIHDMGNSTQIPIVVPQEGVLFTDVIAVAPRTVPNFIPDGVPGVNLDLAADSEDAGILNIRSVYDVDGVEFTPLYTTAIPDIPTMADPGLTVTADDRPARFLRIVKSVGMPDNDTKQIPGTAFGASAQQLMREIVGYVPIQPDGSVRTYVPANVPLAISVVDRDGRRITPRHQNWMQFKPGEEVRCNGCHNHASGTPHGHPEAPGTAYAGAPASGLFPNTNTALFANFTETMAETLTRIDPNELRPSMDLNYVDVWTDPLVRTPDNPLLLTYAPPGLTTPAPNTAACMQSPPPAWTSLCRIVIHYETHIHPLWSVDRGANTCTGCHTTANNTMVPAGLRQIDLTDGVDPIVTAHFKAYRELLFTDNEQELVGGVLQDRLVPGPIDPITGLPTMVPVPINPPMTAAGARASNTFFVPFDAGGTHAGFLTPEELRLLAEWLDIGAQYYNDPSVVP
ncbi:MAG: hypothetical protein WBO34_06125 [Gammaproteobacteria bacterium]